MENGFAVLKRPFYLRKMTYFCHDDLLYQLETLCMFFMIKNYYSLTYRGGLGSSGKSGSRDQAVL